MSRPILPRAMYRRAMHRLGAAGLWPLVLLACGGSSSEPQTPEEAAPDPTEVTAPRVEATPESSSLPVSGAAPESASPPGAPQGKRAPCTTDQSCNDDKSVSALWGRCTPLGVCECKGGFERSPTSDLCRPEDAD